MNIHAQTLKRKKKKTPRKDSKLAESGFKIKNSNVFSLNVSRTRSSRTTNNAKKRREEKKKKKSVVGRHNFCPDCGNRSNGSLPVEAPSNEARRPREVT